jgi:hypothetical protein
MDDFPWFWMWTLDSVYYKHLCNSVSNHWHDHCWLGQQHGWIYRNWMWTLGFVYLIINWQRAFKWYPWISAMTHVGRFSLFELNHHPSKTSLGFHKRTDGFLGQSLDFIRGIWKNRGYQYWVVYLIFWLENHGYEHEKPPWQSNNRPW